MINIPSFYAEKFSYGPIVKQAIMQGEIPPLSLDMDFRDVMTHAAEALQKRVSELVVVVPDRPRNQEFVQAVRSQGAALRMIVDGDIAGAVAPAMPDSGVDLFIGIGGSPEGILTAAALKALDGEIHLRMWPSNEEERTELLKAFTERELQRTYSTNDLIVGQSSLFCATGISDSQLLPGIKLVGNTAITHSILMRARSQTVRYIRAVHNLSSKTIHLRSIRREAKV
jgi:fructose-1,6-bisphosphatase II